MNILTFDYELFGSGKGCVFKHLIKPTNALLKVMADFQVKATFFIEILEVEAIIALKNKFDPATTEYQAAVALERQLDELVLAGHDLQLHLHPQWVNAKYEQGNWSLNFDWWCLSALPFRENEQTPGRVELLALGKALLERRVQRIKPEYQCTIFRAGGYNLGNDKAAIDALLINGLTADSSVCPGFYSDSLSQYDFTAAPVDLPYWFCRESVVVPLETAEPDTLLELPLISIKSGKLARVSLARIYATLINRAYKGIAAVVTKTNRPASSPDRRTNTNFDICLISQFELSVFWKKIDLLRAAAPKFPVVMIGHPKDYNLFSPMTTVLKNIKTSAGEFVTMTEYCAMVRQNRGHNV